MPSLITTFDADHQALIRFYTPPANASGFGRGGGDQEEGIITGKRARLETLYRII